MITVLFGQPCSGKSTLSKELYENYFFDFQIDGDNLREVFKNKDFSKEGRLKNLQKSSDIAAYLNHSGYDTIISVVYPYKEARDYLNSLTEDVKWIYLTYEGERGREAFHVKDFEQPIEEIVLHLDTSKLSLEECVEAIKKY
jgi:adenylylsulfate kinase-like enzyme